MRKFLATVLVTAAATVCGPPAGAKPVEHVRFDEHAVEVVDDFCGDLPVRAELDDRGHFTITLTGPDRLPKFSSNHHGGITFTNLATGKAFTITWDYVVKEVRVTDNGDGTFTVLYQLPGPERVYGPDGQLLYTSGGMFRMEAVIDHGGTPSDPSDDVFVREVFVSDNGGRPQDPFHFCDSFRSLTT